MSISTPNAADVGTVTVIRAGSVTHQVDTDQRAIPLAFSVGAGALNAQAPANGNVAPPGYYMLFIVTKAGVPSVARWLRIA